MQLKNIFHNTDFNKNIIMPNNKDLFLSNIKKTISDLPALNIVKKKLILKNTIKEVSKFSKYKKDFLIFGTGGSNLGSKALINILQGNEKNNINFFDNIDPINFYNSIKKINLNTAGFIIISKSGSTPETLSQFASLIEIFDQNNNLDLLYKNSLVITEDKTSPLMRIAQNNKCKVLIHESDIGGRYSVFSNVGMVPAILAGLDVDKIHAGALEEIKNNEANEYLKIGQFFKYQNINNKISNSVIMTYSDALFYFGKWYLQLWAESIGKNNTGVTAIHAVGTTDQHSQLQLFLDGPKDKFFSFFTTDHRNKGYVLHKESMQNNDVNYLAGKKMGDLMHAEQEATIATFKTNNFSIREVNIPEINEYLIGQLMAFSIMETVAACIYFEVNPFNQPAVEQGKKLTKNYLS